jgi:TatD DNase family protein
MAAELPLDALVVETDSPYLPPQALRGQRNEPSNVAEAARVAAEARELPLDVLAEATTRNACRLYGLDYRSGMVAA